MNLKPQFDFDDILIIPKTRTNISSRYNDITLLHKLPLFTAPMDTVVDLNNRSIFTSNGINVVLPRTVSLSEYKDNIGAKNITSTDTFISFGFRELDYELKSELTNLPYNLHIVIDVANGHMTKLIEYSKKIKELRPDIILMVGNIANPKTYISLAKNTDVDYIRVGIGNGGGCLTTKQSGVGYPMASLIYKTYQLKKKFITEFPDKKAPKIVADGGMKEYSDIIKALALGADFVMAGSIFNKALESCAQNHLYGFRINNKLALWSFNRGFPVKKYFRGMSTKDAQKAMGVTSFRTSEGVTRFRKVEYQLDGWVENFKHYLRNAMSYSNAKNLNEFIGKVEISQITTRAYDRFNK